MRVEELSLPGVKLIRLDTHGDDRGSFAETYDRAEYAALGIDTEFVQDSTSISAVAGTIRGFHFQVPPRAQDKLVRVARGRIYDVVIDIRVGSLTFGEHVSLKLAEEDWTQLFVPKGFAHGFCTLEPSSEVSYKFSDHFSPDHYRGILWNDPILGISWPIPDIEAVISEHDRRHPRLHELETYFRYSSGF